MTREERITAKMVCAATGWGWTTVKSTSEGLELMLSYIVPNGFMMENSVAGLRNTLELKASRDLSKARDAGLPFKSGTLHIGPASIMASMGSLVYQADIQVKWEDASVKYTLSSVERIFGEAGLNMD